ncbi:MAG: hypothetical protein ABF289_13515 [Clostridiales bacterium]
MKIGRREILLLAALGFAIYAFIGINFVWLDFIKSFKTVSKDYVEAKVQYDELKMESKNIDVLQNDLDGAKMASERINMYLSDKDSVIDAIDYLNKLSRITLSGIRDININSPEIIDIGKEDKNKSGKTDSKKDENSKGTYISMDVKFATTVNYQKFKEMISYIEGSAKKITIVEMDVKPVSEKNSKTKEVLLTDNLDVKLKLSFYSLGISDEDYKKEYNFNEFSESVDGILKIDNLKDVDIKEDISNETDLEENKSKTKDDLEGISDKQEELNDPGISDSKSDLESGSDISGLNLDNNELIAFLDGFLVAGENCRVFGFNKIADNMGVKTKEQEYLDFNLKDDIYTLALSNDSGGLKKISGSLPISNNISFKINVSYSDAEIDKNLGLSLKVYNESNKQIKISINDKQGKVKIVDRNSKTIVTSSKAEKLIIS